MSEEFDYEVGDEFEGSPVEVSRFMQTVHRAGGAVAIDGDVLRITSLPPKPKKVQKEAPEVAIAPKPEPKVAIAPKPKPKAEAKATAED